MELEPRQVCFVPLEDGSLQTLSVKVERDGTLLKGRKQRFANYTREIEILRERAEGVQSEGGLSEIQNDSLDLMERILSDRHRE